MLAVQIKVKVDEQGNLTAQAPQEIPAGEHQAVLVIEAQETSKPNTKEMWEHFPVRSLGIPWPEDLTFRREDMYGDDGR